MQRVHALRESVKGAPRKLHSANRQKSPHRENIRRNVAGLLGLPLERVNLKATTEEGLGFTGRKEGIKAVAVVTGIIDRS